MSASLHTVFVTHVCLAEERFSRELKVIEGKALYFLELILLIVIMMMVIMIIILIQNKVGKKQR
jgi:hypothetical protein